MSTHVRYPLCYHGKAENDIEDIQPSDRASRQN